MLNTANKKLARLYPGDATGRQPVHTFIGAADQFTHDAARRAGEEAIALFDKFARKASGLAAIVGLPDDAILVETVSARMLKKLDSEPIEDYRIDFEDGYGTRPDAEEDGHAESAAIAVARGLQQRTLPPFIGIRIKPMSRELHARSLRTLDIFVTTLVRTAKRLPPNFAVTATKVMLPEHVTAVAKKCDALERKLRLKNKAIALELMIETPQSIIAADGRIALAGLVGAGKGRVRGAHFGVYDYTALCGITAQWQHPRHLACDFAREMMRVSLAQTGVMIADGSSNLLPIPPHVPAAWKRHFDDVTHSLVNGYYQGWDLHPGHLVTRYTAVYAFYLSALAAATARLKSFFTKASTAGAAFDDAATGQALVNFFNRGVSCGAITIEEAMRTGLTAAELTTASFRQILALRSA